MKLKNRLASCAFGLTTCALLLSAVPTQAQDKKLGFYTGYEFFHTEDGDLNGIRFSPEYRIKGPLSVVGDFSADFGTIADTDTTLLTFFGGLQAKKRFGSTAIFVHGLAGGVRASSSISPVSGVSISVNDTGFAVDGGGGIEFKLSRFRLRVGADYLRREVDIGGGKTANENDARVTVGFVF